MSLALRPWVMMLSWTCNTRLSLIRAVSVSHMLLCDVQWQSSDHDSVPTLSPPLLTLALTVSPALVATVSVSLTTVITISRVPPVSSISISALTTVSPAAWSGYCTYYDKVRIKMLIILTSYLDLDLRLLLSLLQLLDLLLDLLLPCLLLLSSYTCLSLSSCWL